MVGSSNQDPRLAPPLEMCVGVNVSVGCSTTTTVMRRDRFSFWTRREEGQSDERTHGHDRKADRT